MLNRPTTTWSDMPFLFRFTCSPCFLVPHAAIRRRHYGHHWHLSVLPTGFASTRRSYPQVKPTLAGIISPLVTIYKCVDSESTHRVGKKSMPNMCCNNHPTILLYILSCSLSAFPDTHSLVLQIAVKMENLISDSTST
jgi:hypothetical protein